MGQPAPAGQPYNNGLPKPLPGMSLNLEYWKQCEGRSLDAGFPLERCLGGGKLSAVFETQFRGRNAAVKLIPGSPASIDALIAGWEKSAHLSHPALVSTLAHGETALPDIRCAYAVMERADENLGEVLAERPLTPDETRAMLLPVLSALQYLEKKGFAHGSLKPANIMAFGEQLKISSDSLIPGGDTAGDCLAIGALLKEALGASGANAPLPEPFREIARNCLTADPASRWDLRRIETHLRGEPRSGRGWLWLAAAAALLGLISIKNWPGTEPPQPPPPPKVVEPAAIAANPAPALEVKPPPETKAIKKKPKSAPAMVETKAPPAMSAPREPAPQANGITRVLPEIPPGARNTIVGRVRIHVRVSVDAAGNVNQATLEGPPASKYFTDRVLAAAKAWKFPAGETPQSWLLQFELGRDRTRVSPVRIGN